MKRCTLITVKIVDYSCVSDFSVLNSFFLFLHSLFTYLARDNVRRKLPINITEFKIKDVTFIRKKQFLLSFWYTSIMHLRSEKHLYISNRFFLTGLRLDIFEKKVVRQCFFLKKINLVVFVQFKTNLISTLFIILTVFV